MSGTAVVVAVVVLTWLTLFVLRANIISDGGPLLAQLTGYVGRAFRHLDLGVSLRPGGPAVAEVLRTGLPADLSLLVGGCRRAAPRGRGRGARGVAAAQLTARAAEAAALVAFAAPVYVVGLGLLLLFGAESAALTAFDPRIRDA